MKRLIICLTLCLMVIHAVRAQLPANMRNLSTVQVDKLSAAQISQLAAQLKSTNLTQREMVQYLIARGMPRDEASKLLEKVKEAEEANNQNRPKSNTARGNSVDTLEVVRRPTQITDTLVYGASFFKGTAGSISVPLNLPTPRQYVVGPGDEINLTVFGLQQTDERLTVNRDGRVNIEQVGLVQLGGMTLEQATGRLKILLARAGYGSLSSGQSQLVLSLENPRSISVQVVGAMQSGTFQLPAVANLLHALCLAGGPGENGSFRQIRLIRGGKEIATFDLYAYLMQGDMPEKLQLQANDLVLIPAYEGRVLVEGAVKRPGYFEWKSGESFAELLHHAGGFADLAITNQVVIASLQENALFSQEIAASNFSKHLMKAGDRVMVLSRKPELVNRLVVSGAVNYPGAYAWSEGLTLQDLVVRFGGFRQEALMSRGLIYRKLKNQERFYLRFSPELVASGKQNVGLLDGDSIVVADKREQEVLLPVQVRGEVMETVELEYGKGMSVGDALLLAGGLKKSALTKQIEIARRANETMVITRIIQAETDEDLAIRADEVLLEPGDWVLVRPNPLFREQRLVELTGEFQFPGTYAMLTRSEKLSDLIERAGGLSPFGDANSGILIRRRISSPASSMLPSSADEPSLKLIEEVVLDTIALNIEGIQRNKQKYDLNVRNGDVIVVKPKTETITVKGKVNSPIAINHYANRIRPYLRDAGGLASEADKYRIYVIEPNGQARSTYRFLWMVKYPKVLPGSTIVVPEKPKNLETQRDPARTAAVASIAASSAGVIIAIMTLLTR
ncbi:MAG: hypothetical protein C0424_11965 [Sphingobacteriaceae bacterium]|nr:hypothetical protein [Sphingobacteriaceae bacterium]